MFAPFLLRPLLRSFPFTCPESVRLAPHAVFAVRRRSATSGSDQLNLDIRAEMNVQIRGATHSKENCANSLNQTPLSRRDNHTRSFTM